MNSTTVKITTVMSSLSPFPGPILVIPVLIAGIWLASQKGCVPDDDFYPTPARAIDPTVQLLFGESPGGGYDSFP